MPIEPMVHDATLRTHSLPNGHMIPLRNLGWRPSARPSRRSPSVRSQASMQAADGSSTNKVVGLGSMGVDYLAAVAEFPQPDAKLRTEQLEIQGGGNAANSLTGAARLGLGAAIIAKIGDDALGDGMIEELQRDGVDTTHVLRAEGFPSPFTYIIVDQKGGTRTCIHTPSSPLQPHDMTDELVEAALQDASLVFFDGRLAESAIILANAAHARNIPIVVEAERLRDGLPALLQLASFVTSSAHYPKDATGQSELGDAMVNMLAGLPNARWLISTQGSRGSVMLERVAETPAATATQSSPMDINETLSQLWYHLERQSPTSADGCTAADGTRIGAGTFVERLGTFRSSSPGGPPAEVHGRLVVASAASIPEGRIVDTTGAGDAFNAAVMYGVANGMAPEAIMRLGAVTAGCKCLALGARPGMPRREQLDDQLFASMA